MRRRGGKSRGNSTTPLQPPLREMRVCMRRINKPGETDSWRQREQSDVPPHERITLFSACATQVGTVSGREREKGRERVGREGEVVGAYARERKRT